MSKATNTKGRGKFIVRQYVPNKPINEQPLIAEGGQISVRMTFREESIPAELQPYKYEGKLHTTEDGTNLYTFKFKLGQFCHWFQRNDEGKVFSCSKPTNESLDGNRYDIEVNWTHKGPDPANRMAACGFWANAVLYREAAATNPFADEEPKEVQPVQQVTQPVQQVTQPETSQEGAGGDSDLPF